MSHQWVGRSLDTGLFTPGEIPVPTGNAVEQVIVMGDAPGDPFNDSGGGGGGGGSSGSGNNGSHREPTCGDVDGDGVQDFINPTSGDIRAGDPTGGGQYGDPRTHGSHLGTDYNSTVGQNLGSVIIGTITKIGFVYTSGAGAWDDPNFQYRYVEISGGDYTARIFYVDPEVQVDNQVSIGDNIGTSQDLHIRHTSNMNQHNHVEIKKNGKHVDPQSLISTRCK